LIAYMKLTVLICVLLTTTTLALEVNFTLPAVSVPGCLLNGTLTLTESCVRRGSTGCPTLIILAGSGPTDRDGNSPLLPAKIDTYKLIAEGLSKLGYNTLRFDKLAAAVAKDHSSCPGLLTMNFTVEEEANDVIPLVKYLRQTSGVSKIILAGHSEGSFQAMLMAPIVKADGYISLEGTASNIHDVLEYQLKPQLSPYPVLWNQTVFILDELLNGRTYPVDQVPTPLKSLFGSIKTQLYLISWMKYTPYKMFAAQNIPSAITQGTTDIQVIVSEGQQLHTARPDAMFFIIEKMSHTLKFANSTSAADQHASYQESNIPLQKDLIPSLDKFLTQFK